MSKFYFLFAISMVLFSSCQKDIEKNGIAIGVSDKDVRINNINPDTLLQYLYESQYSIDLNSDNVDDIVIYHRKVLGMASQRAFSIWINIETKNSDVSILVDSVYPKVLDYGNKIKLGDNFKNGNFTILNSTDTTSLDQFPIPQPSYVTMGLWKNQDKKYIGIKYKDRLGWIEIGVPDLFSIKIYEYALSK
jgi:hypothetical protein